jgi:hypothetical protein
VLCWLAAFNVEARETVGIQFDPSNPLIAFAVEDLKASLENADYLVHEPDADFHVKFDFFKEGMGPQSYRIQREGTRGIRIVAGDSLGAMYGGLELAEQISLGGSLAAVREMARKPYILRRGLKFNIPFDGRTPSYDDTGDAAQKNIAVMWDFDFWRNFLDTMARNRYNVLSLWTTHPYGGIVRLPKYPDVNFDNVAQITHPITPDTEYQLLGFDIWDPANHEIIKEITLDEKIAYWTRVFDYAEERGIEIYIFHWNIFLWNALGKYGITYDQDNLKTIEYLRYCIAQFLKTYPQIDGIGVSAGEHVDDETDWGIGIEDWLHRTYGLGVRDALKADPDRPFRCIFRHLMSDLLKSAAAFDGFDVPFNTSHKYARARVYSTTTSPYLDFEYRKKLLQTGVPCWLNIRNDDVYVHRWGDADHVREFLQNVPRDVMRHEAGFYMGPDGYVWGKEFVAKDPELAGQWEVDKHWYRFMLWGRLGYDVTLPRDYFEQRLHQRYPEVDAAHLYDTWAAASRIIPQVNKFSFSVNDHMFSPEGCVSDHGYLTIDGLFSEYPPLRGSGILSLEQYAEAVIERKDVDGITPMEVADNLERLAGQTLDGVRILRANPDVSTELAATITDMESMAYLGRYYASKIRGAAELAIWRADKSRKDSHERSAAHLTKAIKEWEAYARIATSQYRPQLLSRTGYLDWKKTLEAVRREAEHVKEEN